jgi:hypothetical protein
MDHDPSLDTLLLLDGETFVVEGNFWVKFEVKRVPALPEKPHGLDYSLTLHGGDGERLQKEDAGNRKGRICPGKR